MLEKSEAACRKLYSRAKVYVVGNRPRFKAKPSEHQRLLRLETARLIRSGPRPIPTN
jgi:hypothetical protein